MTTTTVYEYERPVYGSWGMTPRALLVDPRWHALNTVRMVKNCGPGSFTELVDPADHPQWITSKRGGLNHLVEFVTWTRAVSTYGDEILYYLACGPFRSYRNIVPLAGPPDMVCHQCHDRHWLKTGEHLPALPQTGCELTGGTAYITERTRAVRAKAAQQ
jgi:hypothetical protein